MKHFVDGNGCEFVRASRWLKVEFGKFRWDDVRWGINEFPNIPAGQGKMKLTADDGEVVWLTGRYDCKTRNIAIEYDAVVSKVRMYVHDTQRYQ